MTSTLSLFAAAAYAADVAPAASSAPGAGSGMMTFLPLILLFAVMYFLMIRPQQKKQKEHQAMLSSIQKGDRVQTNGGLLGTVTGADPSELTLEIAPQVRVKVGRGFIARVIRDTPPAGK
jgi:preprotein translocase subunit YajC